MQAMHQAAQQKQMINGMQRDGSGMAMGDQRPQSPANAENAPSPSKRPRLDGNAFNGQLGPGARSQGMQGAPMGATSGPGGQMMMPNGMPQGEMGANSFNFNGQNPQQKPMEVRIYHSLNRRGILNLISREWAPTARSKWVGSRWTAMAIFSLAARTMDKCRVVLEGLAKAHQGITRYRTIRCSSCYLSNKTRRGY